MTIRCSKKALEINEKFITNWVLSKLGVGAQKVNNLCLVCSTTVLRGLVNQCPQLKYTPWAITDRTCLSHPATATWYQWSYQSVKMSKVGPRAEDVGEKKANVVASMLTCKTLHLCICLLIHMYTNCMF